jgi:hypothetical protein
VRAEDLVLMANAHGVDLMRVAKNMTSDNPEVMQAAKDVVRKRFGAGRSALVLIPPPDSMAAGRETRSSKRPEWTAAELAQAAAGVPDLYFRAALFAYTGDRKYYWWLREQLSSEAHHIRHAARWSPVVDDVTGCELAYLKRLSALVLDEDAHASLFKIAPRLYPVYMHISERTWDRELEGRFTVLKNVWVGWATEALRMIQPKLRQHEETV